MTQRRLHLGLGGWGRELRRLGRALVRPWRGGARGATLVEHLIITGSCALVAILAFNRFGRTLSRALREEARHIQGQSLPSAQEILSSMGNLSDANGICDLVARSCTPFTGYCFAGGTPVFTETGDRGIETIQPGDRVWSMDVTTGSVELRPVVSTFVTRSMPVIKLELRSRSVGSESLRVTAGHRFWVETQGWVRADALSSHALWSTDAAVSATALGPGLEATTVYNLEVSGSHSYFVGQSHALVHNQSSTPGALNDCPPPFGTASP